MKLYRQLSKRDAGNVLYIPDEPMTELHFHDVSHLPEVLDRLRDHGNTVIAIEHNLDAIKMAGNIIAPGPEGGNYGWQIIATGTPEEVAKVKGSHTGRFLKGVLGESW